MNYSWKLNLSFRSAIPPYLVFSPSSIGAHDTAVNGVMPLRIVHQDSFQQIREQEIRLASCSCNCILSYCEGTENNYLSTLQCLHVWMIKESQRKKNNLTI